GASERAGRRLAERDGRRERSIEIFLANSVEAAGGMFLEGRTGFHLMAGNANIHERGFSSGYGSLRGARNQRAQSGDSNDCRKALCRASSSPLAKWGRGAR